MKDFPAVPELLLKALEEAFPDKAPRNPNLTPGEVGQLAGEQKVLDFLRQRFSKQNRMNEL